MKTKTVKTLAPSILAIYVRHMGVLLLTAAFCMIGFLVLIRFQMTPFFYSDLYENINTSFRTRETSISLALLQNEVTKAETLVSDPLFIPNASSKRLIRINGITAEDSFSECAGEKLFLSWGRVCKTSDDIAGYLPIDSADQILGYLEVRMPASLSFWLPYQRTLQGISIALVVLFSLASLLALLFYRSTAAPMRAAMQRIGLAKEANDFEPILKNLPSRELYDVTTILASKSAELVEAQHKATLGEVAAQVAHDIRTPLAALRNISNKLPTAESNERGILNDVINRIEETAEHLLERFKGSHQVGPKYCDAISSIKAAVTEMRVKSGESTHLRISLHVPSAMDSALISIPAAVFRRIIANILNNAVDAVEGHRSGEIAIRIRQESEALQLTIRDEGIGMDAATVHSVLNSGGSFKKSKGHGLGLDLVRSEVFKAGGNFNIISELGNGTTIELRLPTIKSIQKDDQESPDLILIDDDPLIHKVWTTEASDRGLVLRSCFNPDQLKLNDVSADTPIYVDRHLGSRDGSIVANNLRRLGFSRVYLASSDPSVGQLFRNKNHQTLPKEFPDIKNALGQ